MQRCGDCKSQQSVFAVERNIILRQWRKESFWIARCPVVRPSVRLSCLSVEVFRSAYYTKSKASFTSHELNWTTDGHCAKLQCEQSHWNTGKIRPIIGTAIYQVTSYNMPLQIYDNLAHLHSSKLFVLLLFLILFIFNDFCQTII